MASKDDSVKTYEVFGYDPKTDRIAFAIVEANSGLLAMVRAWQKYGFDVWSAEEKPASYLKHIHATDDVSR